ncbi:MAG: hypothetical protein IH934_03010 [Nanoarchaeota archaeon]|nr:hypothetical protein [Nanoarchaeota archaeon]
MLKFIKKFFSKQEILEEKIELNELNNWLGGKTKPIIENLRTNINQIINKISDEKGKVDKNLEILKNAKLQNPKIPERVKTIMEGNRAAFIKKVSFFFNNIDMSYNNHNEILEKCNKIKNDIEILGKGTMRSYQVLNEFFAREAENLAINIKRVENYSNDIINLINNSKLLNTGKIKNNIIDIQNKIKLKEKYSIELNNEKNNLKNINNKKIETENKINGIKSSSDYINYEKLLEERNNVESKVNDIENGLFHDFSVLEKSLKKYAKIAFENEKLIIEYLNNPTSTLIKDSELKIVKILDSLKNAIERNELDLDKKKKEKALAKIYELDGVYFTKIKDDFKNAKKKISDLTYQIKNNNSKKDLDKLNIELKDVIQNIENLNNKILNLNNEIEKIDIVKLKGNLVNEVNDLTNIRITLL